MTLRLVFNPTDGPLTVDAEGHVLGGGEWGSVESTDPTSRLLLDGGTLVETAVPATASEADLDPRFVAARKEMVVRQQRLDQARKLEKQVLAESLAGDESVSTEVDTKSELTHAVAVRDEIEIPRPSRGKSRSSKES